MPTQSPLSSTGAKPRNLKTVFVSGGAAGNLAAPAGSLAVGDEIISVARFTTATFAPGTNLTAEFITATGAGRGVITTADQISNTGGTSTAGQLLLVTYATKDTRA
jgi:hypothetical protein